MSSEFLKLFMSFMVVACCGRVAVAMNEIKRQEILDRVCKIRTERTDSFTLISPFDQMPATKTLKSPSVKLSKDTVLEGTHLEAMKLTLEQRCHRCHSLQGKEYNNLISKSFDPPLFDGYASLIEYTEPPFFEKSSLYMSVFRPEPGARYYESHQSIVDHDDGLHLKEDPQGAHFYIGDRWLNVIKIWIRSGSVDNTGNPCNPVKPNLSQCVQGKTIYKRLCVQCHGINGVSQKEEVPSLASVSGAALSAHLYNLRNGWRLPHPEKGLPQRMVEIAKYELSPGEIEALSQYISLLPARSRWHSDRKPKTVEDLKKLFTAEEIQAAVKGHEIFNSKKNDCNGCHTPTAVGREEIGQLSNNDEKTEFINNCRVFPMPSLLEHPASYIRGALCDLANSRRGDMKAQKPTPMKDQELKGELCDAPQMTSRMMSEQIQLVLQRSLGDQFNDQKLESEIAACDGQLEFTNGNEGAVAQFKAGDRADEVFNYIAQYLRVLSAQAEFTRNPEAKSLPGSEMTCPEESL